MALGCAGCVLPRSKRIIVSMFRPEWHHISEWLKTTIPGIVILGAFGSIIAVLILKIVSALGKRLFQAALDRLFFSYFRPFSYSALLCYRYVAEGRWADLVIYAVAEFAFLTGASLFFGLSFVATIVVAILLGVQSPGLLLTLVVITGVALTVFIRSMMSIAGLWAVRYQHEHRELKNLLSDKKKFYELTDQIFKNMQSPPQSAVQTPPAAATPSGNDQGAPAAASSVSSPERADSAPQEPTRPDVPSST